MPINQYLADHNTDPKPFRWKADPDKIIAAASRRHQTFDAIQKEVAPTLPSTAVEPIELESDVLEGLGIDLTVAAERLIDTDDKHDDKR